MEPSLRSQLQAAEADYRAGRFSQAETAFLNVHARDPNNATAIERLGTIALWRNRAEEAARYFEQALDRASGLTKAWPFNVQLKTQLAMTYYRQDRLAEAARLFKEAAGPIALGPFRELQALGRHLALAGREPYAIEGPEEARIDFVITDPLPVVEVSVNGGRPLPFLIDTGGAEIILDTALARAAGAEIVGTMTGDFGGGKGAVGLGKVNSIGMGDFTLNNVPVHSMNLEAISASFDGRTAVKGVVGTRLLMHFLGTIDYVHGCLTLRRATPTNLQALEARAETAGFKAIPFWLIQTHFMVALGTVNGSKPSLFLVDTGLGGTGFTAPESTLRQAGISVDWSKAQDGIGGGGKVRSAEIVVDRLTLGSGSNEMIAYKVPGVVMDRPPKVLGDALGFRVGGLVSHQFFRDYAVTFDFMGMRLYVQNHGSHRDSP